MTEPLTVTELDAATKEELQPPCCARTCADDPRPAEYAFRMRCSVCGVVVLLYCQVHTSSMMIKLVRGPMSHYSERGTRLTLLGIEPLR